MTFMNYQQPINCSDGVTIETSDARFTQVMIQTGFPIEQTFIDDLRRHYGNEVCTLT